MPYTKAAAAVAALAGVAIASPVNVAGKSSFQLKQVAVPRTLKPNGAQLTVNTFGKFGKSANIPPQVKYAAQSTEVSAQDQGGDEEYLVQVQVGEQTLSLDFDTGSSDLWVFSTITPSSESSGHNLYNPNDSGTQEQGETWSISYGDGSGASGVVYADKVVVGSVTATSQSVEAATSVSSEFTNGPGDGLLGLAFQDINTCTPNTCETFFNTVAPTLSQQLFAARLRHNAAGTYDFGAIDSSLYTGSISYVEVDTSEGYWGFNAGDYAVGNGGFSGSSIGSSIADTGTTLLYLPDSVVTAYYNQVPTSQNSNTYGGYVFDCNVSPPDFTVQIGNGQFVVPGSYINFAANGDGTCFGGIQSSDGVGINIFGDMFLKNQYVIFDQTQSSPRLGFAQGA